MGVAELAKGIQYEDPIKTAYVNLLLFQMYLFTVLCECEYKSTKLLQAKCFWSVPRTLQSVGAF